MRCELLCPRIRFGIGMYQLAQIQPPSFAGEIGIICWRDKPHVLCSGSIQVGEIVSETLECICRDVYLIVDDAIVRWANCPNDSLMCLIEIYA